MDNKIELSPMQRHALTERFSNLSEDEQRIALRCFDHNIILSELQYKLENMQNKLSIVEGISGGMYEL